MRGLTGAARPGWSFHGRTITADQVHRIQLDWYRDNPDLLQLAVARHGSTMDLLGLSV